MDVVMFLPAAVSAGLWLTAAPVARRLPPATAVRLLTLAALLTALSSGAVLAAAAFLVLARLPAVAVAGRWSPATFAALDPVPVVAGVGAGVVVLVLLASAVRRVASAGRDLAVAARTCRRLGPGAGGLVVVDDPAPDAYALPGLGGRVVVSTAMLRALPPAERRALLAHEAAHLRHHHHLHVQLAELAAAANPPLRPLAAAVHAAVERWADEAAAAELQDRALVARALARAGLARARAARAAQVPESHPARDAVDSAVAERTRALLAPRPAGRRGLAAAVVALMLVPVVSAAVTAGATEHRVDVAQAAWARQH